MAEEAQIIEGYGCCCGYTTPDNKEITKHVFNMSRQDGKGTHKSLGRINLQTGDVIMPPYRERTAAQKRQSKYARKGTGAGEDVRRSKYAGEGTPVRTTELLADASEVKFVPRIYTTDYSPIMRAAQEAAVHYWGWPADMTFGDFLGTALHMLFKEHGINLAGFSITEEALLQLQQERSRD